MANMTLAVPDALHKRMKQHTDIKWGDVARQAFEQRLAKQAMIDELLAEDKQVEKYAGELGHKIKAAARKRIDALNRGHELPHRRNS